jgi:DNA-binding transcriptional ArsR family regulator
VNTEKNRLLFKILKDSLAECLHALENPDKSFVVIDKAAKVERDQRQAARTKNVKALKAEIDEALLNTLLELEAPFEELAEAVTGRKDETLESVLSVLLGKEMNAEEARDALEALYEDKSMKRGLLKRQGNVFGRVNDVDAQRIQCARGNIDQEARDLLDNIEALKNAPDDERIGYMLLDDPEVIYSLYEQALVENVAKRMELLDSEVHIMLEGVRTLREAFSKVQYQDVKPSIVRDVFGCEDFELVAAWINRLSIDEIMAAAKQEKTVTPDETGGQFVSMLNKHLQPLQEQRTDIDERIEQCLSHAISMPMLASLRYHR